jgi:hypothetical protein
MLRADKLATIGELAAGAAHEIRNPLTSIRSSLQFLESRSREETEKKLLGVALRETDRIDEILAALLSFSRPSEIHKEPCDLVALLEESVALVSIQAKAAGVEVRTSFPAAPSSSTPTAPPQAGLPQCPPERRQAMAGAGPSCPDVVLGRRTLVRLKHGRASPRELDKTTIPSSLPRRAAPGWACRSSTPSSKRTAGTSSSAAAWEGQSSAPG